MFFRTVMCEWKLEKCAEVQMEIEIMKGKVALSVFSLWFSCAVLILRLKLAICDRRVRL